MAHRDQPIRRQLLTLVLVPLVSLIGLWSLATYLTVGDGVRLYNQGTLITEVAAPAEEILSAIQTERRASMVFVADPRGGARTDLNRARAGTDGKIAAYRAVLDRGDIRRITPDRVMALARAELAALDRLAAVRSDVDARRTGGQALMDAYTELVDPLTPFYAAVATFPDDAVSAEGQALQRLAYARELRARVDAVLAGALAAGGFTRDSYVRFAQGVGLMRAEYHEAYVRMTDQYRVEVDQHFAAEPYPALTWMENTALNVGGAGPVPVDATRWRETNTRALADLSDFQLDLAKFTEENAKGPAYLIFGRILLAGLLGLVAVVVTVWISLRIARRLAARLRELRDTAHALADEQLPDVVRRLRAGEPVDVDAEAPVLSHGADEFGEVGNAFNTVRRTAVGAAVEQAELRAGVRNVFLNIARRSQTLVRRQLNLLDAMERKTVDAAELADLFAMDHLATRMRRYAENLVILGGAQAGRTWGEPVPMQDVLRGAASEAEHYERVRVLPFPPVVLAGSAVSDVIHLVAELIDNATTFSPPHTTVQVFGQLVPHGFAVEVEDRGLGMSDEDLAAANRWLAEPPEFNVLALRESPRLGMFVVARIAAQNGIRVALRRSGYGGVTAIVLIPPHLVAEAGAAAELSRREAEALGAPPESSTPNPATPNPTAPNPADPKSETPQSDTPESDVVLPFPVRFREVPTPPTTAPPSGRPASAPAATVRGTAKAVRAPRTGKAGAAGADEAAGRTHLGLPVRVRQARLAPGLRDEPAASPPAAPTTRSPEEIRTMMTAYQRGTARGRQTITGDAERPAQPEETNP
ncbi:sensor histidine kinase [Rhizomonospora bruguierae]|uniref:sensor histidine kinase n=1 Tax=Rhizomonospora bruguierae TaxID=1581705 RepID=UPI001BCD99AF|nr:nitrate- and nitrite sensing domain-containing protein [Micromonospora sp. NBRC 107566]